MIPVDQTLPFLINFIPLYNTSLWDNFEKDLALFLEELSSTLEKHLMFTHTKKTELNIVFSNNSEVHNLNKTYRHKDSPTNVLSFTNLFLDDLENAKPEEDLNLGDVILAYETIEQESKTEDKEFISHTKHLVIHGVLHVLGYDHMDEEEAKEMESLEIQILQEFNINNPYE